MSQEQQTDSVSNYITAPNRSWGSFDTNGSRLYFFGKIQCDPNNETIREMITKIRAKYKKIIIEHKNGIISVMRLNCNEQINFVPIEDNSIMAKRINSQHKSDWSKVFFSWYSQYQILEDKYWKEKVESEEKQAKFDEIREDTQGLMKKDLLLEGPSYGVKID